MLHIVKQFMSSLTMGLKFGLDGGGEFQSLVEGLDSKETKETAKTEIMDFLKTLDVNSNKTLELNEVKTSNNINTQEYNKFLESIGIQKREGNDDYYLEFIEGRLNDFINDAKIVKEDTKYDLVNLSKGVSDFKEEKSGKYYHDKAKDALGDYENPEEFLEDVNHNAAKILFSENKASEILTIIKNNVDSKEVEKTILNKNGEPVTNENGDTETETVTEYSFDGSSKAEDLLVELGYEADGIFGADELHGLFIMAKNLSENEAKASNATSEEVFKMLSDFDGNGMLQTHNNFYMGELQSWYLGAGENFIGSYENLYKNLGMDDIKNKLSDNFYATEQEFQLKLATYIQNGVKPAELFSQDGLNKSVTEMYAKDMNRLNEFSESQQTYVKSAVEAKLQKITGGKIPNLSHQAELIAFESLTAIDGGADGLAAGFDITELTDDLVDNLALGYVGGNFGIILSKKFYEQDNLTVTGSLVNLHIPIGTASYELIKADIDKDDLVYAELGETKTSVYASISTLGKSIGVQVDSIDNDTKAGIEAMGVTLKTQLIEMIKVLKTDSNGENPVEIKGANGSVDTTKQKYYDQYFSILQNIAEINNNILVLENTANSLVSSYKDDMYRNAEQNGLNLASVGAGVIFLSDIMPLPYITAGFEDITTKFNTVDHSYEREKSVTKTVSETSLKLESFKNYRVISFPNDYQISVPEGYNLQAQVEGDEIKLGGEIKSIVIHEHVSQTGVVKTVVIDGGNTDEAGLYKPALKADRITQRVTLPESTSEISSELNDAINSTKSTRELINKLFSQETLTHPETKGAVALQKDIFKTLNSNFTNEEHKSMSLNSRLNELKTLVNNYLTEGYLKKIGANPTQLDSLKSMLNNLNGDTTLFEKQAILQSVQSNFMEKNALVVGENNNVTLVGYNTIADYDSKKRGAFFDQIFEREYGAEFANEIAAKREEWLENNGTSPNYTFTPSNGNLALTGVKLGSLSKASTANNTGVMAYEGVYNLATVNGKPNKIPLDKNEAFVNNLPDSFLENVKNQLIGEGAYVETLDDVKNAINTGVINGIKIDYKISFARMGECLNDAIILDDFTITGSNKSFSRSMTSTMNLQDTDVDTYGYVKLGHIKMKSDNTQTQPTTDQNEVKTETNVNQGDDLSNDNINSSGFGGGDKNTETSVNDGGYTGPTKGINTYSDEQTAKAAAHVTTKKNNDEK